MTSAIHFVEIFEVGVHYPTFEFLELLDRHEAAAHPMAGIGAGADQFVAIFAGFEDVVGRPGLRMIVQSHANLEFFAEFIVNFGRGSLGHQHLDAHLLGPFEVFASAGFVAGNRIDAISHELEAAGVGEFLFHFVTNFVAHFAVHGLAGAGLKLLAGIDFQIFDT